MATYATSSLATMFFLWMIVLCGTLSPASAFAAPGRISASRLYLGRPLFSMVEDDAPSDYDAADLEPEEQSVAVDLDEDDASIRDALKRELLLLSSVTNRGEYASQDERDIVIDLIAQLEALNPTADPASNCVGEWDLCLSSTQFFRTSPFFLTIRAALGEENKAIAENGFDIHDRATSAGRIGRVREVITDDGVLSNQVDLEVGLLPGFPVQVKGTVITSASMKVTSSSEWELKIQGTKVKGSNVPLLNQFLDDAALELPIGDIYGTLLQGEVPIVTLKTFYVDEGIRITRDVDNNFYVFSRA